MPARSGRRPDQPIGTRPVSSGAGLSRAGWGLVAAWSTGLVAVLLHPMFRPGYGLGHDLVFTPQQPMDRASIGVSTASPRAVPVDAVVALVERLLDGAVVFRGALLLPLLAAGLGTALALRPRRLPGALAAASLAIWNPYVVERLAIGQWTLIWAYAALPWLVLAARLPWRRRAALTVVAVGAASLTPTGGLVAAGLATVLTLAAPGPGRAWRDLRGLGLVATVGFLQLPWVLPSVLSSASSVSDPAAVAAFASRSDVGPGVWGSLVAGAGIWDADVVPDSRQTWLGVAALAVLLAGAALGASGLRDRLGGRVLGALGASAAVGLVLAALAALPGGAGLLRWAVATVPGAGLLRDGQKWAMVWVFLAALLLGSAVDQVSRRVGPVPWRLTVAVAAAVGPTLLLPDGAATVAATVSPVHYPADWATVRRLSGVGGDAVVLPFAAYRSFAWAPGRPVLDPAPRLLSVPVVVDDRLSVSGRLLRGEDPRAAAVARVLTGAGDPAVGLARQGVRWVVVEHGTPGPVPDLSGLQAVYAGDQVSLYAVPGAVAAAPSSTGRLWLVGLVDGLALAAVLAAAVSLLRRGRSGMGRDAATGG